jgi:hypothetical protein
MSMVTLRRSLRIPIGYCRLQADLPYSRETEETQVSQSQQRRADPTSIHGIAIKTKAVKRLLKVTYQKSYRWYI